MTKEENEALYIIGFICVDGIGFPQSQSEPIQEYVPISELFFSLGCVLLISYLPAHRGTPCLEGTYLGSLGNWKYRHQWFVPSFHSDAVVVEKG